MVLSKVGSIEYAVKENLFPRNIAASENFQLEEKGFERIVSEGQHKHGNMVVGRKKDDSHTTSIIESFLLRPELPFAILTYGLGDLFTGLFALKCNYVKWQGSLNKVQLYVRHNLTDERMKQFLLSNSDYDIHQKVSTLS